MATEEQRKELEEKVTALVATRFGGDYRAAFGHYGKNGDGKITPGELKALLSDAGIGSSLTRWAWTQMVTAESRGPSSPRCSRAETREPVESE